MVRLLDRCAIIRVVINFTFVASFLRVSVTPSKLHLGIKYACTCVHVFDCVLNVSLPFLSFWSLSAITLAA